MRLPNWTIDEIKVSNTVPRQGFYKVPIVDLCGGSFSNNNLGYLNQSNFWRLFQLFQSRNLLLTPV